MGAYSIEGINLTVEPFYITITNTDGIYSADKTYSEIESALMNGMMIYCVGELIMPIVQVTEDMTFKFACPKTDGTICACTLTRGTADAVVVTYIETSGSGGTIDKDALEEYVKNTDYATSTKAGVVKVGSDSAGVKLNSSNMIVIAGAGTKEINEKASANRPITPYYLDWAIKVGLTKNALEFTDAEKSAARTLIDAADQNEVSNLQEQNVDRGTSLWAIVKKTAFAEALTDAELTAFKTAWGITDSGEDTEVTLSSISATYSGGSVLVGTSVNALTGIVVTAKYSDGSTKTVTGYTLSGTIAEGSNTVTISYGGKSTTITVIGYAENEEEVTLTSISATYTGGEVTVGTALTDLTGITVTGHYSDGSTGAITGYTLSGEIVEGSNTITVSYGGKTTTFTVTGVEEETGVSNETTWTSGVPYTFEPIENEYPDKATGEIKAYNGWARSPYLYCAGASTLRGVVKTQSGILTGTNDNAFYDADKNFISHMSGSTYLFTFNSLKNAEVGTYHDVPIPENAVYFIISGGNGLLTGSANTNNEPYIEYVPYE